MRRWLTDMLERWKRRNDPLDCPACHERASPQTFARGRYRTASEPIACDRESCKQINSAVLWRAAAFARMQVDILKKEVDRLSQ